MRLFVVIPAYNEERRITATLDDYTRTLVKKYGNNVSILVVSDSTDKTDMVVSRYGKNVKQIRVVHNDKRLAKGGSVKRGFGIACSRLSAKDDIIGFADADDSIRGEEIIKMVERLRDDRSLSGVIGSRYMEGGRVVGQDLSIQRVIASRVFNAYVRLLFGFDYKDTQCGAKFFKRSALKDILSKLVLSDITFDINLLFEFRKAGHRVIEVPITYYHNDLDSKMLILKSRIVQMFVVALGYRIVRSRVGRLVPKSMQYAIYGLFRNW